MGMGKIEIILTAFFLSEKIKVNLIFSNENKRKLG